MEIIAKSVNRENFNYTTHIIHKDFRGKIVELGNRFILTCSSRNLPFYPNLLGISNSNTFARGKSIVSDSSHGLSTYMAKGRPVPANRPKTGHANWKFSPAYTPWKSRGNPSCEHSASHFLHGAPCLDSTCTRNGLMSYGTSIFLFCIDQNLIAQSAWMSGCGELYITFGYLILSFHLTQCYLLFNKEDKLHFCILTKQMTDKLMSWLWSNKILYIFHVPEKYILAFVTFGWLQVACHLSGMIQHSARRYPSRSSTYEIRP